jgi:heme exporter protein D
MTEFFNMGGYGSYVWTAYGIAAVVLGGLVWQSLRSLRASERDLATAQEASPRRRQRS